MLLRDIYAFGFYELSKTWLEYVAFLGRVLPSSVYEMEVPHFMTMISKLTSVCV